MSDIERVIPERPTFTPNECGILGSIMDSLRKEATECLKRNRSTESNTQRTGA